MLKENAKDFLLFDSVPVSNLIMGVLYLKVSSLFKHKPLFRTGK